MVNLAHYDNSPMQYSVFLSVKNEKLLLKDFDIFLCFAQYIDCGNALGRGGSNEYSQCFGPKIR